MFALQPTTPSLTGPLLALIGCVFVAFAVGAVGSAVVRRLSNPVGKYRSLYVGVILPLVLVTLALLTVLDFGAAVAATLSLPLSSVVGAAVAYFADVAGACLVGLAAYTPTIRGVRAVRGISLPTGRSLLKMSRWALGLSITYTAVRLVLQFGADTSPLILIALVAGLLVGLLYASPWLVGALRSTSTPDGEAADRLDRLCSRAALPVAACRLLDTDDEGTAELTVRGLGRSRHLFVSTTFLSAFDDETATALLAVQAGRVRARRLQKLVSLLFLVVLLAALPGGSWLRIALALLVIPLAFWVGRRGVRAADDNAADRLGGAAVAEALERYAAVHEMEPTRRKIPNPLSPSVPLGNRIDRLRE